RGLVMLGIVVGILFDDYFGVVAATEQLVDYMLPKINYTPKPSKFYSFSPLPQTQYVYATMQS
ncbi:hypothetical protein, partial [Acinetobacter sp.]|uniref:hypothetical protein n=1 Tax=Acinetobacter sp. TaxID=472 RepID=UPI00257ADAA3